MLRSHSEAPGTVRELCQKNVIQINSFQKENMKVFEENGVGTNFAVIFGFSEL